MFRRTPNEQRYLCMKRFLIISNSLNLGFGICLIIMGSYVHLFLSTYLRNVPMNMVTLTFIIMAHGCLLFTIGNIGIISVLAERRIINTIYTILLIVSMLITIVIVTSIYVLREKMITMFRNIINDAIDQHMSKYSSYTKFVDTIQSQHNCCGADSHTDYTVNNLLIPMSCYPNESVSPYTDGCAKQLNTVVGAYLIYVIILLIVFIPIELVSMFYSMRILNNLENISWRTRFVYC
ncbi:Tetraspanin-6 [Schistosoma japonicum]|uniref:Tetraspanin n=1 Tax=Schistosoma japonicum TaxID=6182 RepID=A0A4Z2DHD0_SCHJA|nr:cd63 antigen-like [Schistosoma japonicum]TNN15904.1 Tetraspanin-6 [Schistosoma japonicum]